MYIRKDVWYAWNADILNAVDVKAYPNPKINIGLNVLRRRNDGFHDIETLFIPLTGQYGYCGDLQDTLEITPRVDKDVTLKIIGASEQWDKEKDLCVRAYRELAKHYDIPGIDIRLIKKIPTGAGLGGGSSDAAFTMKLVNELFGLAIDEGTLAAHAARIGSDTSFFIYNRPMFASGRGEILEEVPNPVQEGWQIEVVTPEIHISTAEAYGGVAPHIPESSLKDLLKGPAEKWKDTVSNDFEKHLFIKYPALQAIKRSLYDAGALYASMSGSGSAIYGIFRSTIVD